MKKNISLSKSQFLEGSRCPKLLWLRFNKPDKAAPVDTATQYRFNVDRKVEKIARRFFPDGQLIQYSDHSSLVDLVGETQSVMSSSVNTIYEATFSVQNMHCRTDILSKSGLHKNAWALYEIKASTKIKKEHMLDVAFQYECCWNSGVEIDQISIIHISDDYFRIGNVDPNQLLTIAPVTHEVIVLAYSIKSTLSTFISLIYSPDPPDCTVGSHCKYPSQCPYYAYCYSGLPESSIYELPYGSKVIPVLLDMGVTTLNKVPDDFELSNRQRTMVQSVKENAPVINHKALSEFLKCFHYPLYFLDFETVSPAVPPYNHAVPYERIPFQYSLHVLGKPDAELIHQEYLHEKPTDSRFPILLSLIENLGESGSIVAWNMGFEISVLKTLSRLYREYSDRIDSLIARFVDLIIPFRGGGYADFRFKGSASIKAVLPVLIPELSYEELSIKKGDEASILFERYLNGDISKKNWQQGRKDLLSYCKLDTLAMVEIYLKLTKTILEK